MKKKPKLSDFQEMIDKLGKIMLVEIKNKLRKEKKEGKLKQDKWNSAYLEARWISDGDGLGRKSKVRIELADGKRFSIYTTDEMADLLDDIGAIKNKVFPERWYGLKLTVLAKGEGQLELNPDPNCYVEPGWYKT